MRATIASPNSVLANALKNTLDILRPRLAQSSPEHIEFVVGTQINGTPHLGTSIVQCCAFVLAQHVRHKYSIDTSVTFSALDNAPHDIKLDPESFHSYQITYRHALGEERVNDLIRGLYLSYFDSLSDRTDVAYRIETYSDQQMAPEFRKAFLVTLGSAERFRWCMAPSAGTLPIRIPCPDCKWAEKRAERTRLLELKAGSARFEACCFDHHEYEVKIEENGCAYFDLNTLYRNVVKELSYRFDKQRMRVMVKGGDWAFGCQLVDWALNNLGAAADDIPVRVFCPQVVTETGAKLSKSLIREGALALDGPSNNWMLDTGKWTGDAEEFVDAMLWLVETFISDPKHFFRGYSYKEVERILAEMPKWTAGRETVRTIQIYRKYFDMIASGKKTIEVRVGYSGMRRIKPGQLIRFACQDDSCLRRVVRVTEYPTFDDLFKNEKPEKINSSASAEEQIREIRKIFPPEKERLGALAFELVEASGES